LALWPSLEPGGCAWYRIYYESADEYGAIVDDSVKKPQPTLNEIKAMSPPASLKEWHEYEVKATDELVVLYRDSAAAARAGDVDKLVSIVEQLSKKTNELISKADEYSADFIHESSLRKLDDALRALDGEISRKRASL
jgi:hypothetical protein